MKKNLVINIIAVIAVSGLSFAYKVDICNIIELHKATVSTLEPFNYSGQQMKKITLTQNPITLEIEVPLSLFGKYRMVFNTSGMPIKLPIEVYNKAHNAKNRNLLWSNERNAESEKMLVYDPPERTRSMFVDIDVPADSLNKKTNGCIYMVLGYK